MRFGIFLAPFHAETGQNPASLLARDVDLVKHLDRLGFDEAWIGEHHSCGTEMIAQPGDLHRPRGAADAAHQARHRRALAAVPQPAVGGRPHDPARPPDPRAVHARPRPGCAAHRRRDDRHRPGGAARRARGGHRGPHAAAARRRADLRRDHALHASSTRAASCARTPIRASRSAWPAIASPSGPRIAGKHGVGLLSIGATMHRATSTCSRLHWDVMRASGPASSARWPIASNGASSARCTSRRPGSRPPGGRVRHRRLVRLPAERRGRAALRARRQDARRSGSTGSTRAAWA